MSGSFALARGNKCIASVTRVCAYTQRAPNKRTSKKITPWGHERNHGITPHGTNHMQAHPPAAAAGVAHNERYSQIRQRGEFFYGHDTEIRSQCSNPRVDLLGAQLAGKNREEQVAQRLDITGCHRSAGAPLDGHRHAALSASNKGGG